MSAAEAVGYVPYSRKGFTVSNSLTPSTASPFDSYRRVDDRGEFWSARELMTPYGYEQWRRFEESIERAKASARNNGIDALAAFVQVTQLVDAGNLGEQERIDYRLTRYAAYLVAMNGDPRKPEIAAAQSYFAIKTREAEARQPDSDLSAIRALVDSIEQDRRAVRELAARQRELEAKVSAAQGEYREFTTLAYAKLNDLPTDRVSCQKHGQRASKLMRQRGQKPRKREDATFGTINVYPADVLEETAES